MDRPLVGRLGIGGLIRQPAPASRRKGRRRTGKSTQRGFDRALARLAALISGAVRLLGDGRSFIWGRRRLRIAVVVLAIATPLLAGGWFWLRGSSLVAVKSVRVSGAHGSDAHAIDAALKSAALRMTTLNVHTGGLRAAVAGYPEIRDVQAKASFPHGLSIRVIEQPPVAALSAAGTKIAVAADGVVLGSAQLSGSLPTLTAATALSPGQHIRNAALLGALSLLGAAPPPLARQVERAYSSSKGLTLVMRGGLLAYFGGSQLAHAKWQSLAAVLADKSSAGASYVDVRLPERPAAGFPAGSGPASTSGEAGASTAASGIGSSEAITRHLSEAAGNGEPTGVQPGPSGEVESKEESASEPEASSTSSEEAASAAPEGGK